MDRQTVINRVYALFADAGDDELNCAARLELLNVHQDEIEVAEAAYEGGVEVVTAEQAHGILSDRGL